MAVIELDHVTKEYHLGELRTVKQSIQKFASYVRGKPFPQQVPFRALDDVDFGVAEGEVLGIVGQNGAGKSTLLGILARIITPTRGNIRVNGTVAPLIEVGAGLVRDLTGRENVYLNAAISGMRSSEIAKKFDEIVAFAELERFIDTPIKRYSSGMKVRLAFSIATCVNAEILIVDEVLAVGDLAFQRKCFDRMEEMIKRQGKTVVLVSHNIRQVERLCNRVILLDQGKIFADGQPTEVCDLFFERSDEKIRTIGPQSLGNGINRQQTTGEVELVRVDLLGSDMRPLDKVQYLADLTIAMRFRFNTEIDELTFGLGVHTTDFLYLTTHNSDQQLRIKRLDRGEHEIRCLAKRFPLLPGVYSLRVGVTAGQVARPVFYAENVVQIHVVARAEDRIATWMREGFVGLEASWEGLGVPITQNLDADVPVSAWDSEKKPQAAGPTS